MILNFWFSACIIHVSIFPCVLWFVCQSISPLIHSKQAFKHLLGTGGTVSYRPWALWWSEAEGHEARTRWERCYFWHCPSDVAFWCLCSCLVVGIMVTVPMFLIGEDLAGLLGQFLSRKLLIMPVWSLIEWCPLYQRMGYLWCHQALTCYLPERKTLPKSLQMCGNTGIGWRSQSDRNQGLGVKQGRPLCHISPDQVQILSQKIQSAKHILIPPWE